MQCKGFSRTEDMHYPQVLRHIPEASLRPEAGPFSFQVYRGISLTKQRTPLGPHRKPMPRVLGAS